MSKKAIGFTSFLFVLAGIGVFSMFYNDWVGTLQKAGIFLIVGGILYLVYRLISKSAHNTFDSGYKKALQLQKRKNKGKNKESVLSKPFPFAQQEKAKPKKAHKFKNLQKRSHSFQVIEGKKNKNERTKTS